MRCNSAALIITMSVSVLMRTTSAAVIVLAPLNIPGVRNNTHIASSNFVYFGPRPGYTLSGPGVFLSDAEACAPTPKVVQGTIVVTRWTLPDCLIEDIYESLCNYGAIAYVVLVRTFYPIHCSQHTSPPPYFVIGHVHDKILSRWRVPL